MGGKPSKKKQILLEISTEVNNLNNILELEPKDRYDVYDFNLKQNKSKVEVLKDESKRAKNRMFYDAVLDEIKDCKVKVDEAKVRDTYEEYERAGNFVEDFGSYNKLVNQLHELSKTSSEEFKLRAEQIVGIIEKKYKQNTVIKDLEKLNELEAKTREMKRLSQIYDLSNLKYQLNNISDSYQSIKLHKEKLLEDIAELDGNTRLIQKAVNLKIYWLLFKDNYHNSEDRNGDKIRNILKEMKEQIEILLKDKNECLNLSESIEELDQLTAKIIKEAEAVVEAQVAQSNTQLKVETEIDQTSDSGNCQELKTNLKVTSGPADAVCQDKTESEFEIGVKRNEETGSKSKEISELLDKVKKIKGNVQGIKEICNKFDYEISDQKQIETKTETKTHLVTEVKIEKDENLISFQSELTN